MNNIVFDMKPKQTTLCLNMIVKNESKVIQRLLESVAPIIDSYCICDTGSTDNTVEIIQTFFEKHNIPGRIICEPFKDFGYNRTFALNACTNQPLSDYILLLDADMVFWINPKISIDEFKLNLVADAYTIFQGRDDFYYKNIRIIRNNKGCCYWGVTHEYVKMPSNSKEGSFEKSQIFIIDVGDGGSKSDKFERDIRLLEQGLIDHPDNDRYTFYLANSYHDSGNYEKAIENYEKRVKLGGWFEEIWYSYYKIGMCYAMMNKMEHAINAWMNAYDVFPNRIENLYEIVKHYRSNGKNKLAHAFYELADEMRKKHTARDYLFLKKDIYDYKLDYEFSIIAYYANPRNEYIPPICMKICQDPSVEEAIVNSVLSNYKFYTPTLCDISSQITKSNMELLESISKMNIPDGFSSTTPSIYKSLNNKRLYVIVRYVNYVIDENGNYENKETINTINHLAIFNIENDEWSIETINNIAHNTELDNVYVGLEDMRIFEYENRLFYNANRGLAYHSIKVEHGEIDITTGKTIYSRILKKDGERVIEKNWVLFEHAKKLHCIYEWYPLTIGTIENDIYSTKYKKKTSNLFKQVRGSTNGQLFENTTTGEKELWFLCHTVSYEDRRYYYHIFVCLDVETLDIKKYTPWFTFDKKPVEYSLGFAFFNSSMQNSETDILIGYSSMDNSTKYITVSKTKIDDMMIMSHP
jgi:tetratricopeptide (TPR) repeat protein